MNLAEYLELEARAREDQQTIANYIRTLLEWRPRWVGNVEAEERAPQECEARERLDLLGLNPAEYFPEEV